MAKRKSVAIIEKEPKLPDKAPDQGKDELVQQSHNQAHPSSARAADFHVLEPDEKIDAPIGHGQCGRNESEYHTLLKKGAADKGKSKFREEPK